MRWITNIIIICALAAVSTARAHVLIVEHDFDSSDTQNFSGNQGWEASWDNDPWRTDLNNGVSPSVDEESGSFGTPPDAYENQLINTGADGEDVIVEVIMATEDYDTMGVIFRWTDEYNYYMCYYTNDVAPGTDAVETGVATGRMLRVVDGEAEVMDADQNTYEVGQAHKIRVETFEDQIRCYLGSAFTPGGTVNEVDVSSDPLMSATDASHTSGMSGLFAFAQGDGYPAGDFFDDFSFYLMDTDDDGISNDDERTAGTDVEDADSDDDGLLDGDEASWNRDTDKDGKINALDYDSDNDGLPDGLETGVSEADEDTDTTAGNFIADEDPSTTTDPLDPDTDDDGVPDGDEDANQNGMVDPGESDPNDETDNGSSDAGIDSGSDADSDADSDTDADTDTDTDTDDASALIDASADGETRYISGGAGCGLPPYGAPDTGFINTISMILKALWN